MNYTAILLTVCLLDGMARASDFSITWSTIDAGGGLSASGDGRWVLPGPAGLPDAGVIEGGARSYP